MVTDGNGDPIIGANFTSSSFPSGMETGTSDSDGYLTITNTFVAGDVFVVDVLPGTLPPLLQELVTVGSNSPQNITFNTQVLIKTIMYVKLQIRLNLNNISGKPKHHYHLQG